MRVYRCANRASEFFLALAPLVFLTILLAILASTGCASTDVDSGAGGESEGDGGKARAVVLTQGPLASFSRPYASLAEEFSSDDVLWGMYSNAGDYQDSAAGVAYEGEYPNVDSYYDDSARGDGRSYGEGAFYDGDFAMAAYPEGKPMLDGVLLGDAPVVVTLGAEMANQSPSVQDVFLRAAFVLVGENGEVLRIVRVNQQQKVLGGQQCMIEGEADLSIDEYRALSGVGFACLCASSGDGRAFDWREPQPLGEAKQSFESYEITRSSWDNVSAWRARHSPYSFEDTLLVGDSLMQNAHAALESALPGVEISADGGRSLEYGGAVSEQHSPDKGVLDCVRADDGSHLRYVIGTGNNDPNGMTIENAEEIVGRLGGDKEIYFITEIVTTSPYGTAVTNSSIEEMARRYSNVHVIDWHGLVAGREREYLSDGCHVIAGREPDYAACIATGLRIVY